MVLDKDEGYQEIANGIQDLSFHHVDSGSQTQIIRCGDKCPSHGAVSLALNSYISSRFNSYLNFSEMMDYNLDL